MMFWYGHGGGGWGWLAVTVGMVLFWALVLTVVVLIFRALVRPGAYGRGGESRGHPDWRPGGPAPGGPAGAEQILAERYARGEIEDEEYQRRLSVLRASHGGPTEPDAPGG
ncbi:SHOCT domain-containing protein [Streptomyces sp. WZ-12]|uniref:SHOCT domain-containing protein n=1 Tax=Streptomyces sp. WZ-12 TaxID=3030210 RepID=UPI002380FF8E|nr:SHOCT domain-containing protein [Streptomyces sp. WZ-12]